MLELDFPGLSADWWNHATERLPADHRQARPGQACDPPEHHHREHQGTTKEQPPADDSVIRAFGTVKPTGQNSPL
jgi:hypothetical protein